MDRYDPHEPSAAPSAGGDDDRAEPLEDDYFVRFDGGTSTPPPSLGGSTPPQPGGTRWLGSLAVLLVALGGAVGITALLLDATGESQATASSRSAVLPVVEDGFELWATNADGSPVRWNACEPIRWVFNPDGAPVGATSDLESAMRSVSNASGLEFEFVGQTAERPSRSRDPYQPDRYGDDEWAPVLIAWASTGADVPLEDRDRAVAIPIAIGDDELTTFVSGQIVFNTDRLLQPGFGDRAHSLGSTAMHELGHLVGLDHVSDPDQLMFAHPHLGPVQWGEGDRRGLAAVGDRMGCTAVPRPQAVEVTYVPEFGD